jgi:hypothetical protein
MKLVEIEPGRFRFVKPRIAPARSSLPMPYVISDEMPPVEQVDGRFYTSKRKFRAVGREHGLTEVGNERPKPMVRSTAQTRTKHERRAAIKAAVEKYKSGQRTRR